MQNMEVVTIEQATFELLRQKLDDFVRRMDDLCAPYCKRHIEWLDNCEVTRLLAVSSRTLQTYRDTGKLRVSPKSRLQSFPPFPVLCAQFG